MNTDKDAPREEKEPGKNEAANQAEGELTEEQLDNVAGGIRGPEARNYRSPFDDVEG